MLEGASLGPYRVVRKLGEGGMGIVFEAIHVAIERHVAIKVLHAEFAKNDEFANRFVNEARAVNRVDHPGLVQVSDYGKLPDGTAYIVMEYLRGETLRGRLERTRAPLPAAEAVMLSIQLADSLAAAHEKSIVHRDLKPDNVMIIRSSRRGEGERTKLLDFGIAKLFESGRELVRTRADAVMGTPVYMSPEHCKGAGCVDHKSDVYSLGVMMYQMLAGGPPFRGEGIGEILGKHMYEEPPMLSEVAPQVPRALTALVHDMLRKDKNARPDMSRVVAALETIGLPPANPQAWSATPVTPAPPALITGGPQAPSKNPARLDLRSTIERSVGQSRPIPSRKTLGAVSMTTSLMLVVGFGGHALVKRHEARKAQSGPVRGAVMARDPSQAAAESSVLASSANPKVVVIAEPKKIPLPQEVPSGTEAGEHRADRPPEKPSSPLSQLIQQGRVKLEQGEPDAAAALFTLAVGLDGRSVDAIGGLGRSNFEQGNFEAAERYLRVAVQLSPRRSIPYHELLMEILYKTGKIQESVAASREILKLAPRSAKAQKIQALTEGFRSKTAAQAGAATALGARAGQPQSSPAMAADAHQNSAAASGSSAKSALAEPPQKAAITAFQLYYQGRYEEAQEVGRNEVRSGAKESWRIVGMAACRAQNGSLANEALRNVQSEDRQQIMLVCHDANYRWINGALRFMR